MLTEQEVVQGQIITLKSGAEYKTPVYFASDASFDKSHNGAACYARIGAINLETEESWVNTRECQSTTEAELWAIYFALSIACTKKIQDIFIQCDCLSIVLVLNGSSKNRDARLVKSLNSIRKLVNKFNSVRLQWVPRSQNRLADQCVRK